MSCAVLNLMLICWCFTEYELARNWILANMTLTRNVEVQLFEITIRALGGLLSIYHLSGEEGFLSAAVSEIHSLLTELCCWSAILLALQLDNN